MIAVTLYRQYVSISNYFVGNIGAQIYAQSQRHVMQPDNVTEVFTARQLSRQ
jgi:hypothetical protein